MSKHLEIQKRDIPDGSVGENLLGQCRGRRFDLWSRRIPLAVEQLTPRTATTETSCCNCCSLHVLEPVTRALEGNVRIERRRSNERPVHHNLREAHTQQ